VKVIKLSETVVFTSLPFQTFTLWPNWLTASMCNLFLHWQWQANFEFWKVTMGRINFYWMKLYSFP